MQDKRPHRGINGNRMLDWQDISTAINALKVGIKSPLGLSGMASGRKKAADQVYCETKPGTATTMDIKIAPQARRMV